MAAGERIILALDVATTADAARLVEQTREHVGAFKVGLELVNSAGVGVFAELRSAGAERIFYDAKLHDIPNTVAGALRAIARHDLWMVNLHAAGGSRMIWAAAKALAEAANERGKPAPFLIGVTLLTSLTGQELKQELQVDASTADYASRLAGMAKSAGADGVVASPLEIEPIRAVCGPRFLIVTPGVRPAGSDAGDQRRTMTPAEAVCRGADYLVIGRPITAASDPTAAARRIADELESYDRSGAANA